MLITRKFDRVMKKKQKSKHFVHKPTMVGGEEAIGRVISENLRYPEEALQKRVEGTVSLRYTIGGNGRVVSAEVLEGIGHGCDEEAIRLVKLLRFSVQRAEGLNVFHHRNLQIHFKLNAPSPEAPSPSPAVQIQLAPPVAKKGEASEGNTPKPVITYTIRI